MSVSPEKQEKEAQSQLAKNRPNIFMVIIKKVLHLLRRLRIPSKPKREFFYYHEKMNMKTPEDYRTEAEKRFPSRGLW
jgi:hypothetical protein